MVLMASTSLMACQTLYCCSFCILQMLKNYKNISFVDKNQYVWWWYNMVWNRALAKIWVMTIDMGQDAKFQVRLVLNCLP